MAFGYPPRVQNMLQRLLQADDIIGLRAPKRALHLAKYNGGFKVAQIHLHSTDGKSLLSDELLFNHGSILTLLVIGDSDGRDRSMVRDMVEASGMPREVLSAEGVHFINTKQPWQASISGDSSACLNGEQRGLPVTFFPSTQEDAATIRSRLGWSAKFAIVRPDYVVFATATSLDELSRHLQSLRERLGYQETKL